MSYGAPEQLPPRQAERASAGTRRHEICIPPGQVRAVLEALDGAGLPPSELAVHFHDTYGQALANTAG